MMQQEDVESFKNKEEKVDNNANRKVKVSVYWNGGSIQVPLAGEKEEDLWKPVGEIAERLAGKGGSDRITVIVDDKEAAQLFVEDGSVKPGDNKIRLRRSCYGVKKMRKIDPMTGAHQFYDLIPNNMGQRSLDIGARFGQTGGTNAGADMVEGAFVLKSPMPSWMYWPKYYQLVANGYIDFTDEVYDEDEEIRKLEALFGPDETPVSDEDDLVLRINEFLEKESKDCLAQLNIDFVSSRLPFNHRQVGSAWREWKKFRNCVRAKDANEVIVRLLAITNASFKEDGKKKALSSFLIKESDPATEMKEIEKKTELWESLIHSMEAVLPLKTEKGKEKKKTSPFGNIEMELATKEETHRWLEKFHAPDDLAYRVVNVNAPDFLERTQKYAAEKGITVFDYFVHGSPNPNWKSLIIKGPLIYADAPIHGKAYDYGVYTGRHFQKSRGYSSLTGSKWTHGDKLVGIMGIYWSAFGRPLYPDGKGGQYRKLVLEGGYDCLDAKAEYSGYRMDEVVFYEEAALALVGLIFFAEDEEILTAIGL